VVRLDVTAHCGDEVQVGRSESEATLFLLNDQTTKITESDPGRSECDRRRGQGEEASRKARSRGAAERRIVEIP
jgi:hypothetical protein